MRRTSNHTLRRDISLRRIGRASTGNDLLLALDQRAALAAPGEEEIGDGIALEGVGLAELLAFEEMETRGVSEAQRSREMEMEGVRKGPGRKGNIHPSETADAVRSGVHQAVVVDALVAGEGRITLAGYDLAVDEAGAESCLEACGREGALAFIFDESIFDFKAGAEVTLGQRITYRGYRHQRSSPRCLLSTPQSQSADDISHRWVEHAG